MDQITRAWFGLLAENALLKKKEQEYEDFFCDIMEKKYGDNFQLIKAAGREGDGKADGYLIPEKCVYQSYAPSSGFRKDPLLTKIENDFKGAKDKWGDKMDKWTFVHCEPEGLPKYALDLILELKEDNQDIEICPPMRPSQIKDIILSLNLEQLVDIFGPAPTQKDIVSLTHEPVKSLLRALGTREGSGVSIAPVSVDKLEFNDLSNDIETLLTAGRRKEKLVEELLAAWLDPEYGEELAESFRAKYQELKSEANAPDDIFMALRSFAGGDSDKASIQVSSLAVLSYFFERCDIFENAPEGWVK